jgi:hypothetical protein
MPTTFHRPINGVSTTVVIARTAGVAPLVVADGSLFGATFPIIIAAIRADTVLSILEVTGRSGNTLTISAAIEGTTDVDLIVGDLIEMRPTALAITEIHAAVNTLETTQTYVHTQSLPSATWTITHNLGRKPAVTVVDSADSVVVGFVQYLSLNSVQVTFSGGFSGLCYLN